ncbi:MAG: type 4a pilus biogenesis protein PilO [Phycisphaerae bacterium]
MQFGPRTFIFFVLLLAMPVAAYFMLFKPLDVHLADVKARTQEKAEKLQELADKLQKSPTKNMETEIQQLHEVVALLEHKLPTAKETEAVYNDVWNLAVKNHLNIKSVRTNPVIEKSTYSSQSIRMVITGPMKDGFYRFLSDVERQLKRLTRITDMSIQADEKVPGNVQVDMTLTVYFESGEKVAVAQ